MSPCATKFFEVCGCQTDEKDLRICAYCPFARLNFGMHPFSDMTKNHVFHIISYFLRLHIFRTTATTKGSCLNIGKDDRMTGVGTKTLHGFFAATNLVPIPKANTSPGPMRENQNQNRCELDNNYYVLRYQEMDKQQGESNFQRASAQLAEQNNSTIYLSFAEWRSNAGNGDGAKGKTRCGILAATNSVPMPKADTSLGPVQENQNQNR